VPIQINEEKDNRICIVHVSGELVSADYAHLAADFERLVKQNGKLRVMFEMCDFRGWDAGALWQELKFDVTHFGDIERLACVGNQNWQLWLTDFCMPFTKATIEYFECTDIASARKWLISSEAAHAAAVNPPLKAPLQPA
jgi:hypothetical protein